MIASILMLYGPYAQHPWREDMFIRPDLISKELTTYGLGFDIAMVAQPPVPGDTLPDVRIARSPLFSVATGHVMEAHFKPGTIAAYAGVIDHWVHNFQDEIVQPDGTYQRTAHGIGLSPERLWNHRSIQNYGNHKDKMDALVQAHGVGLATYRASDYDTFADEQGGGTPLIFKPQGGSLGVGIRIFQTAHDLKEALRQNSITTNGLIQPYRNTKNPIRGIKAATKDDDALLRKLNIKADRPREIRMHVIASTNWAGELHIEAYPMMKVSEPGRAFMKYQHGIGIDPSCLGPGTVMHDKSIELAKAVCYAAGQNDKPIPQYYGVFDWLVDGDVHDPEAIWVSDGNCRGPGLPVCAYAAREAFIRAMALSAKKAISLSSATTVKSG